MSRAAPVLFALVCLVWAGFTAFAFVGTTFGDCPDTDTACHALKDRGVAVVLWRWAAVQLALLLGFLLYRRRSA